MARPKNRTNAINLLVLRGTKEYGEWLEKLADHDARGKSDLLEEALRHYAKKVQFEAPPKRTGQ